MKLRSGVSCVWLLWVLFGGTVGSLRAADPMALLLPADVAPEVVAVVNGKELTREQLAGLALSLHGPEVLQRLVLQELVRQEAAQQGVTVTAEEIATYTEERANGQVEQMARRLGFKDVAAYAAELSRKGVSIETLRQGAARRLRPHAAADLLAEKLMRRTVQVTEDDLRSAFDRRYGPKVKALQIVLGKREEAEAVIKKLSMGADFGKLARDVSLDRVSRRRGGALPPLPVNSVLGRAAAALKPGRISGVVQTPHGFHVLKLLERLPAEDVTFEDVKERLRENLILRRVADRSRSWLRELTTAAEIRLNL